MRLLVTVFIGLLLGSSALAAGEQELEYRVKAAYLYNFARFVGWPNDEMLDARDDFFVCVYGKDPFGRVLDATLVDKSVDSRGIKTRRVSDLSDMTNCRIIFVPSTTSMSDREQLLDVARERPILTVGEDSNFGNSNVMIHFLLEQGKVKFAVNLPAAQNSNLKISSKLLRVAAEVETSG